MIDGASIEFKSWLITSQSLAPRLCLDRIFCVRSLSLLMISLLFCAVMLAQPAMAQGSKANQADWHYTLRPGDSLQKVAKDVLNRSRNWNDLVRYNQIAQPGKVLPGSIIKIPIDWLKQQPKPAQVLSFSGSVLIKRVRASKYSMVKPKTFIHVGDELSTRKGTALIKFADGTILHLENNSSLQFNRLSHYGSTGMVDTQLRLKKGSLSTEVAPLKKGSRYEIKTPSAVAAVRGTKFRLEADEEGTKLEVLEGAVDFSHEHGSKTVREGNGAQIKRGIARIDTKTLLPAPTPVFGEQPLSRFPKTLAWKNSQDAERYKYQLTNKSANGKVVQSGASNEPELEIQSLADGEYQVAMQAVDSEGFTGFDAASNVSVEIDRDIPMLIAPQNDSILDTPHPQFSWKFNFDDTRGTLELARDEDFKDLVTSQNVTANVSVVLQKALDPGTYYWRIITDTAQPENSVLPINSFAVRGNMKPVKVLSVNYIDNQVGLFWNTVKETKGYILQLSDDKGFENILKEETLGKNSAHLRLQKGKTYYARVKGIANDQFTSEFGPVRELEIKE